MSKSNLRYGPDEAVILPSNISAENARIVRDHIMRAREELDRVIRKMPEVHARWVYLRSNSTALDIADVLEAVIDLQNWLDREYLIRASRNKRTENHNASVVGRMHHRQGRFRHMHDADHCSRASSPGPTTPSGGLARRTTPIGESLYASRPAKPPAVLLCRPKSEDEVPTPLEE
jgi:hypothetical protein